MTIDRSGNIEPMQNGKKIGRMGKAREPNGADSISVSPEALEIAELYKVREMVKEAADIRMDRVEELSAKINDPSYFNDTVLRGTTDRIMEAFGLS
jgi:negative regulator of flagellin synthesis FlgM